VKFVVKLGGAASKTRRCSTPAERLSPSSSRMATRSPSCMAAVCNSPKLSPDGQEERVYLRAASHRCRDPRRRADGARGPRQQVARRRARQSRPIAMGLSGGDGHVFRARKKKTNPDLGFVGEIAATDPRWLEAIWKMGAVPVISSIALASTASTTTSTQMRWPLPAPSAQQPTRSSSLRCPRSEGRGRQRDALALACTDSCARKGVGRLRRYAAQAERLPRCAVARRQTGTHPACGVSRTTPDICSTRVNDGTEVMVA